MIKYRKNIALKTKLKKKKNDGFYFKLETCLGYFKLFTNKKKKKIEAR
jgi:hypothetical protein